MSGNGMACLIVLAAGVSVLGARSAAQVTTGLATTQPASASGTRTPEGSPTTRPGQAEISLLISELSAPNWRQRRSAQEKLVALGEAAEAVLRQAGSSPSLDPESRKSIELLLRRIEADRAAARSLITLKYKSARPRDVYASLAQQANVRFAPGTDDVLNHLTAQSIDVDLARRPFWEALIELNRTIGVAFHSIDSDGSIVISPPAQGVARAPAVVAGAYLVTINRVETHVTRSEDFSGQRPLNAGNNMFSSPPCRLYLFAWAKPDLKPICWSIGSLECVTDSGDALKPLLAGWAGVTSGHINTRRDTMLVLGGPVEHAKSIRKLRFSARFIIERKRETLDIPQILTVHNATFDLGGFRLLVKEVNKVSDGRYAYSISVYRDAKSLAEWDRMRMLMDAFPCKLVDADGNALRFAGGGGGYGPNEIFSNNTLSCDGGKGQKAGEPVRLVWEFPTEVEEFTAPLEFDDIPLP